MCMNFLAFSSFTLDDYDDDDEYILRKEEEEISNDWVRTQFAL